MPILPPSSNAQYAGAPLAAYFLSGIGVLTIVPGLIHTSCPTAAPASSRGSTSPGTVPPSSVCSPGRAPRRSCGASRCWSPRCATAAWCRCCSRWSCVERSLIALNLWLLKAAGDGHHPPAAYATLVALPLFVIALALSLRGRGR